jgi:hypothetical protein
LDRARAFYKNEDAVNHHPDKQHVDRVLYTQVLNYKYQVVDKLLQHQDASTKLKPKTKQGQLKSRPL